MWNWDYNLYVSKEISISLEHGILLCKLIAPWITTDHCVSNTNGILRILRFNLCSVKETDNQDDEVVVN